MNALIAITTKVSDLQRRLKAAGAYVGAIDGLWGPQTDAGLDVLFKRAQKPDTPQVDGEWANPQVAMEIGHSEAVIREAYLDGTNPQTATWTWSVGLTSATGHDVSRYINNPQPMQRCMDIYVWALRSYCRQVNAVFKGTDLSLEARTGFASFHWNTGGLRKATWVPLYKAGRMDEAEASFKTWNKSGGRTSKALVERRAREADLIWRGKWAGSEMMAEYQVDKSHHPIWASRTMVDVMPQIRLAFAVPEAPNLDQTPKPFNVPEVPTLSPLVAA